MENERLSAAPKKGQQPQVLVVDDEAAIRLPISLSLTNAGYQVLEAESGTQALAICADQPPDLVLLDVVMDDLDGFATCSTLRGQPGNRYLPIIMMTSLEDEQTVLKAFEAGATDYITKPLNLLILGFRIQYWLRSSSTLLDLQNSRQRLSKAQQLARLGHFEWDPESDKITVECDHPEDFGMAERTTMPEVLAGIITEDRSEVAEVISSARAHREPFTVHYRVCNPKGEERIILNQGEFITSGPREELRVRGIVQDVTSLKQAENKIRYLAFYDSLTGLANRSLFSEHWKKMHSMASRDKSRIAVMFIDLDYFKQINDTLGHQVGDQVLISIAKRLKAVMRQSDVLGRAEDEKFESMISRLGGDEFTLLAPDLESPENAAKLAERIIEVINKPLHVAEEQLNLSASIGISVYPEDGDDIHTLLKHADTAMYEAKNLGRNNFQFFHQEMNDVVSARFHLQNRLRNALAEGELTLYYQTKVRRDAGDIRGVEALLRWQDPEKGLLHPDDFLPFAEETGFIHHINDWVIMEVCSQAKVWVDNGHFTNRRVSLNISGRDINFKALEERIKFCLETTGLAPEYLEIELTERVMMQNTSQARKMLFRLRSMGVSIAIDDFGTGYSALSHLQVFPLTTLKIDKSFIKNITDSGNANELILSIVNIAKSLNLNVVAEGVETESQRSILNGMDCDELQGFLFSHPLPATEVEKYLK